MTGLSPVSVLFSSDGYEVAVQQNTAIPANTRTIISSGSDGTNARPLAVNTSGQLVVVGAGTAGSPSGGVFTIQGVASGTAITVGGQAAVGSAPTGNPLYQGAVGPTGNIIAITAGADGSVGEAIMGNLNYVQSNATLTTTGSVVISKNSYGTQQINMIVNVVNAPTGTTPSMTVTVQEVDPGNITTTFGNSASTSAITAAGVYTGYLTATHSSAVKVTWTITGTTPSFTGVYITLVSKITPDTQVVSGTVTAANASVSTNASAPPGSSTLAGGSVTTASPTYTTGQMNALSLTTAGALRVDGSGVTQPVSGTITANAGTGNFNVIGTGSAGTAATGVVTIQGIASMTPVQVSQATAANLNATVIGSTAAGSGASTGLVTIQGNASGTPVPVSGTVTATNASVSTNASATPGSSTLAGGAVTTAAPTYTTGQMNALSLNTSGGLRVDGSGVTQPVSGTVTANAGTGSFTVAQSTAANLNATVIGSTAAGSGASSGLVTIQGNASGTPVPVSGSLLIDKSTTGTITSVAASVTSVTLLASNANRVDAVFWNDSTTGTLYIALSASSTTTIFTAKILPGSYWELPCTYTGAISGIWNAAVGSCRITELT